MSAFGTLVYQLLYGLDMNYCTLHYGTLAIIYTYTYIHTYIHTHTHTHIICIYIYIHIYIMHNVPVALGAQYERTGGIFFPPSLGTDAQA